jgi:regulatory protein
LTESEAYLVALRILTRCDRSEADLRQRLQRRKLPDQEIEQALQRCRELGYINDQKLARHLASQLLRSGRAVGRRLQQELSRRGISRELAGSAAAEVERDFDQRQLLGEQLQRRYPDFDPQQASLQEKRRLVNYFQRRGFSAGLILEVLDQELPGETGR